jgi:DNA gyrase subunit B
MLKVTIDDAMAAERAVEDLMGTQVEKRKDFIQNHAKDVQRKGIAENFSKN